MKIAEICGIPHLGKTLVGNNLASRFGVPFFDFPNFNFVTSYTGMCLAKALKTEELYKQPRWWSLISAANMVESMEDIKNCEKAIIVNYKNAYSGLFSGVFKLDRVRDQIRYLPEPNTIFYMYGQQHPTLLESNKVPFFVTKAQLDYFASPIFGPKMLKMNNQDERYASPSPTIVLNRMLDDATELLIKKGWKLHHSNKLRNIQEHILPL